MGDKYSENSQTALVVISGNEGEIGTIVHTNNLIKNLLGYKRAELLDRNVSIIMPKIFGDGHNAILSRFISASESTVNGNERTVPALQKDGYMLPVTALTKALPNLSNGIQIVGYL
jgi:PAS domain S-box-containing protein